MAKKKKLQLNGLSPLERKKRGLAEGRRLGLVAMQTPSARRKRARSKVKHGVYSMTLLSSYQKKWKRIFTQHLARRADFQPTDLILVDSLARSLARQEIITEALRKCDLFHEVDGEVVLRAAWHKAILREEKHAANLLQQLGLLPLQRLALKSDDGGFFIDRMMSAGAIEVEAEGEE